MMYTAYKYKLSNKHLRSLRIAASKVNFVWNYCNNASFCSIKDHHKFLSAFDLNNLTSGTCKALKLHSATIQSVCAKYFESRERAKKRKLKWRTGKSLSWIPFKTNIKIKDNQIKYAGVWYKFHKSREPEGRVCSGSFVQDASGSWYVSIVCEVDPLPKAELESSVGIDLGLDNIAATSSGEIFGNPRIYRAYEEALGSCQRHHKSKQATKLHRKIVRVRWNNLHKISAKLAGRYQHIIVGDLKLRASKSVNDSAYRGLVSLLEYKVSRRQGTFQLVSEAYTTVTCSSCLERSGPTGLTGLSVREWTCERCGQTHSRDVNAAKNILRLGMQTPMILSEPQANLG